MSAQFLRMVNNDKLTSSDYSRTLTQQDALITQTAVSFEYPIKTIKHSKSLVIKGDAPKNRGCYQTLNVDF